ncbi:MAG: DUF421 domain-containing protein [Bacillota bacterium]|nr:DUF421 domain-containing protein [Bacillota bacterium]
MFIVMIRTAILYALVVAIMRLMGKRQIGELQPFELVIAIMVSDLASIPMQDTRIPIIHGIIPIITLLILQVIVSVLQLKSEKARILICGKPTILVHQGKINIDALRDQRFNINDLMEEIRLQGYFNLSDIHCAILETSGQLSIIPKSPAANVTRDDLKISTSQDELPITLIMDGKVNKHSLELLNKNKDWLDSLLKENNILSSKDVFVGIIDSKGKFFYQCKEGEEK